MRILVCIDGTHRVFHFSKCLSDKWMQVIIKTEPAGLSAWITQAVTMFLEKWTRLKIDVLNVLMSRCETHPVITEELAAVQAFRLAMCICTGTMTLIHPSLWILLMFCVYSKCKIQLQYIFISGISSISLINLTNFSGFVHLDIRSAIFLNNYSSNKLLTAMEQKKESTCIFTTSVNHCNTV